ncbi:MAG: hypothetical protein BroJett003_22800 [Planctomycetota bacterium]|nr:MAG: hypothetical protein BroJett003_22800 [Planctomycetota bacterium]
MLTTTMMTTASTPCLICEAENKPDALVCSRCYAPMALIHEAAAQDRDPCIVSVIGESNTGKTVYLGTLLDMLSKRAGDFEAVPKGAYSVNLQHNVVSHLGTRQFPPKTPTEVDQWHWAYYQVAHHRYGDMIYDLVMPDMAGEALAAEVSSPKTYTVIRSLLEKSAGSLLLVDAGVAAAGSPQPDFFALKLLSYLDGIFAKKRGEKIDTPVAIVLCKGDYCPECFDDPRIFAKTNLNRTWNLCESRFEKYDFFAASVVGSLGYAHDAEGNVIPYPLHCSPRGILEPFEWVLAHLS